jgi:hypothetical protein
MPKLNSKSKKSSQGEDNGHNIGEPRQPSIELTTTTASGEPASVTLEVTNGKGSLLLRQNTYQCGSAADVFSALQKLTKMLRTRRRRDKSRST